MGHILRIDTDKNIVESNHQGWTSSPNGLIGNRIEQIPDTLTNQGSAKAGTAIPSPFARLYLFDAAFRLVLNNTRPAQPTLYHTLVSHCLDLIELLFQSGSGQHSELTYKIWRRIDQLKALDQKMPLPASPTRRHPHRVLAKALSLDLQGDLAELQTITLIYYKGALIGGTSPLSLVFTSPNMEQELFNKVGNEPIRSTNGRALFQAQAYVPLALRDEVFITYVRRFYDTYKDRLIVNSGLIRYLFNQFNDNPIPLPIKDELQIDSFEPVKTDLLDAPTLMVLPGVPLWAVKPDDVAGEVERTSDFVMVTTETHYQQEKYPNGIKTNVAKPLALVSRMDVQGRYVKNTNWNPDTVIPSSIVIGNDLSRDGLLVNRRLPGVNNIQYPFVTTDDFLEDFLVEMPFPINNRRFFLGTHIDAKCPYLLPIRKEYFNFFNVADLQKQFHFNIREKEVEAVLYIPVRGAGVGPIKFSKKYIINEPDTVRKLEEVGLGFFPFYKFNGQNNSIEKAVNQYTILLADGSPEQTTNLGFYRYPDIVSHHSVPGVTKPAPRSPRSDSRPASYFFKVDGMFDLIELSVLYDSIQYRGLIIPQFNILGTNNHRKFTFAIDFGTSNTHVAYQIADEGHDPEPLTVTDIRTENQDDQQVVLLNKPYEETDADTSYKRHTTKLSFGSFEQLEQLIRREFVPVIIGDQGSRFAFPLRTTVYEREGLTDGGDYLFSKLNLGFNIDLEYGKHEGNHYQTNLKWLFENRPNETLNDLRVRAFFETLLLLIRNKILLNKGDISKTTIVWLKPSSMSRKTAGRLSEEWEIAMKNVFGSTAYFRDEPILESLAPYFYLQKQDGFLGTADSVNVDIGGGTSDIMVFAEAQKRYLNTSFRFAANDIWGSGLDENGTPSKRKDNGFTSVYKKYRSKNQVERLAGQEYIPEDFLKNDGNNRMAAEDVVSLLFKYDDYFQFSKAIKNEDPDILIVLYLHYAAIIYHLVQLLEENNFKLPRFLSFTGRGSQYINLLGKRTDLEEFTRRLLKAYTNLPIPNNFKILTTQTPKENTANGAVLYQNAPDRDKYNDNKTIAYWGAQIDKKPTFVYNETRLGDVISQTDFQKSVLFNVQDFLEKTLKNESIKAFFNEFDIRRPQDFYEFLVGPDLMNSLLNDCYSLALKPLERDKDQLLSETFFFLPLKHALYELAKNISEKEKE